MGREDAARTSEAARGERRTEEETRLDSGRGVVERRVELEPVPDDIFRGRREQDAVVHIQAYREHACSPDTAREGRETERETPQVCVSGLFRAMGVNWRRDSPRKKETETRTAACRYPIFVRVDTRSLVVGRGRSWQIR